MDGRMFDGIFTGLLVIGALIGLGIAGLIWLIVWLCQHVRIEWVA
jgi:hypothetical protein